MGGRGGYGDSAHGAVGDSLKKELEKVSAILAGLESGKNSDNQDSAAGYGAAQTDSGHLGSGFGGGGYSGGGFGGRDGYSDSADGVRRRRRITADGCLTTTFGGISKFNSGVTSLLDGLLPTEFLGKYDIISRINERAEQDAEYFEQKGAARDKKLGGGWDTAGDVYELLLSLLPDIVSAYLTAPAEFATTTEELVQMAEKYMSSTAKSTGKAAESVTKGAEKSAASKESDTLGKAIDDAWDEVGKAAKGATEGAGNTTLADWADNTKELVKTSPIKIPENATR